MGRDNKETEGQDRKKVTRESYVEIDPSLLGYISSDDIEEYVLVIQKKDFRVKAYVLFSIGDDESKISFHESQINHYKGHIAQPKSKAESKKERCKKYISELLKDQDMDSADIFNVLREKGIGDRTVQTAKAEMNITTYRKDNAWHWHLEEEGNE